MGGFDAKQFVHLPAWAKWLVLAMLLGGVAASATVVFAFFDAGGARDWVVIGISGGQFMLTSFVLALVLFFSETDANIATLRDRSEQFLGARGVLGIALAAVTPADRTPLQVARGDRRDLFGYDYSLSRPDGEVVIRLWCGLNVNRFIVIYRFADPSPADPSPFADRIRKVFEFSLGGAEAVNYKANYEPVPDAPHQISVWLTVATAPDLLTNPGLKLFWAQDIAMMTESVLRTAQRRADAVRLETRTPPLPL